MISIVFCSLIIHEFDKYLYTDAAYTSLLASSFYKIIIILLKFCLGLFTFKKNVASNGVIYYFGTNKLTSTKFSNPATNEKCSITVKRSSDSHGHAHHLLNHGKKNYSCTENKKDSWWQVDLGEDYKMFVTHYTLRHGHEKLEYFIRYWKLEGRSHDDEEWQTLRSHENDTTLHGGGNPSLTGTWDVKGNIAMRYFRIFQTGNNSHGEKSLCLSGFEMYGILFSMQ
jgi:hypothetical protein